MSRKVALRTSLLWVLGLAALLLGACGPAVPPDYWNGPRNSDGQLIDRQTGLPLPGQPQPGGGGMN